MNWVLNWVLASRVQVLQKLTPCNGEVEGSYTAKAAKRATAQEYIDSLVKRIVAKFHSDQIILFGSQTRGEAGRTATSTYWS